MKKIPMRQCVVSREKLPKSELIRVVKTDDGYVIDMTGKINGHGVYLKKDVNVIKDAKSKKILDKIFEDKIEDSIYDELLEKIK